MHESERNVVDFDPHAEEYLGNRHAAWAQLRQCPVSFSPRYGGFWVVSGYDEVAKVARDEATFSSRYEPGGIGGIEYLGITGIPRARGIPQAGIAEADRDVHVALRRLLNPFLLPGPVEALGPFMRATAAWFLDQRIMEGTMDLVLDFANPIPAVVTMKLIGLPCEEWEHYAEVFHGTVAYGAKTAEHRRALSLVPGMMDRLLATVEDRRANPRDDILTALAHLRLGDRRTLTGEQLGSVLWNLVGGGLDTTTSLTALALHHLDGDHQSRRRLMDGPELLSTATEEYLRYFCVNEALTRTVSEDTELAGQRLARGDYLMMSWLSANLDESEFTSPEELVLDRAPNRHLAFGVGAHRCIGMHLARSLFRIMMNEVLSRIPDYRVDRGATRFYEGNPELTGVVTMPATFTPGNPAGPSERPF
ncbi:MAG: cytochrome P450 [Acidimicrobiales bacterium]